MKRREFIGQVLATSGLLSFPFLPTLSHASSSKKVLIAGGGISGLYAADLLVQQGFEVQVLEATERLGGKLFGGTLAGQRFDFGGQAVSKDMKRVKKLAKRFGLTMIPKPQQEPFYLAGKKRITGAKLEPFKEELKLLEEKSAALYRNLTSESARAAYGQQSVMSWAKEILSANAVDYFRTNFSSEWCAAPETVSLLHYLEFNKRYEGDVGEMDFRFREGLYSLVEGLGKSLKPFVKLNSPLQGVTQMAAGVSVQSGGRTYSGDFLILAIPLTCLKAVHFSGFDSSPLEHSLAAYQGAAVQKFLAVYEKPFWKVKPTEGVYSLPCGFAIMDNSDEAAGVYSIAGFIGGPAAREQISHAQLLENLAKALGKAALRPLDFHVQTWLPEQYRCGGYSANRKPSAKGSEPVPSQVGARIFLAGSNTADVCPSYVEGALSAAERAAASVQAFGAARENRFSFLHSLFHRPSNS